MRTIAIVRESFPDPPALGTAVARATLHEVARGRLPETVRLSRPPAVLAFGSRDRSAPGYDEAVGAARAAGFAPVQRLAGGRAAALDEGTITVSWAVRDPDPASAIAARFQQLDAIVLDALTSLRVDARLGPVPGEYCEGEHSINARGRVKLMGAGQRVVAGGAHVGALLVVSRADAIRSVLTPVYRALDVSWDPDTVGAVEDEMPGTTWEDASATLARAFAARFDIEELTLPSETLDLARRFVPEHTVGDASTGS
ncbi:MAG: lipoate--protein ligase family protein [Actinomycetota bacterium]